MTIEITPQNILTLIAFITAVSSFVTLLAGWVRKAKEPNEIQNKALGEHEKDIKDLKVRMENTETEMTLVMKGILVLIDHSIDGNNVNQMKKTKNDIRDFLLNKK